MTECINIVHQEIHSSFCDCTSSSTTNQNFDKTFKKLCNVTNRPIHSRRRGQEKAIKRNDRICDLDQRLNIYNETRVYSVNKISLFWIQKNTANVVMDNKKGHVSFPASHVIFEGVRIKLRFDYSE